MIDEDNGEFVLISPLHSARFGMRGVVKMGKRLFVMRNPETERVFRNGSVSLHV